MHRLPGHFGPRAIASLDRELKSKPGRILVQYVPHAFGFKAMNFPFVSWLYARRRANITVMFHEVAYPVDASQSLKHNLLGVATQKMAAIAVRAAGRVFVSTSSWEPHLRAISATAKPIVSLPVPSNLPVVEDCAACECDQTALLAGRGPNRRTFRHLWRWHRRTTGRNSSGDTSRGPIRVGVSHRAQQRRLSRQIDWQKSAAWPQSCRDRRSCGARRVVAHQRLRPDVATVSRRHQHAAHERDGRAGARPRRRHHRGPSDRIALGRERSRRDLAGESSRSRVRAWQATCCST